MKTLQWMIPALAFTALCTACSKKEAQSTDTDATRVALRVAATINKNTDANHTRANNTEWQQNDAIGLILFDNGTSDPIDEQTNCKYITVDGTGMFGAADKENEVYYPSGGKQEDILAYYPYNDAITKTSLLIPIDVSTQNNLAAIDIMTSDKIQGISSAATNIELNFTHRLSKLVLKIVKGETTQGINLAGAKASLIGTPLKASLDLALNTISVDNSSVAPLQLSVSPDGTNATAIVIPTPAILGRQIVITLTTGERFIAKIDADKPMEEATENTLTLTLLKNDVNVNCDVRPWISGPEKDYNAIASDITSGASAVQGIKEHGTMQFTTSDIATPTPFVGVYPITYNSATDAASIDSNDPAFTPIYWDQLTKYSSGVILATYTYKAIFVPTTEPIGNNEKDYLLGSSTATSWGTSPSFINGGTDDRLSHSMSQVSVKLIAGSDYPNSALLNNAIVSIIRNKKAVVDLTTSTITTEDVSEDEAIVTLNQTVGDKLIHIGVIAPHVLNDKISVMVGDKTYKFSAPLAGWELNAGEHTVFNLTINKSGVESVNIDLTPWIDKQAIEGDVELE